MPIIKPGQVNGAYWCLENNSTMMRQQKVVEPVLLIHPGESHEKCKRVV